MNKNNENRTLTAMRLAQIVKDSVGNGERFCFVLGAGASKESGIKTGIEMAREWGRYIEEHPNVFGRDKIKRLKKDLKLDDLTKADSKHYSPIYDFRWWGEPRNSRHYIVKTIENASPSYGYYPLAMQLAKTRNNLVITTNFDYLAEEALSISTDARPLVVGHESLTAYIDFNQTRPIIAKLHRDRFLNPLSGREDTNYLKGGWKDALTKAFEIYIPLVIGYAGGDHSLMNYLKDKAARLRGLYWCHRKGREPSSEIQELVREKQGFFIEINGFDSIMCLIGNEFGYASPSKDIGDRTITRVSALVKNLVEQRQKLMDEFENAPASDEEAVTVKNLLTSEAERQIEEINRLISQNPNTARYYNLRGDIYWSKKNYEVALNDYNKAVELEPGNALYYTNRGLTYHMLEEYQKAIEDETKAIEMDPYKARYYYRRGLTCHKLKEYQKAIEDKTKAVEMDPGKAKYYYSRGLTYHELQEYRKALDDKTKAVEMDPGIAKYYYSRGLTYYELQEYQKALDDETKALELDPGKAEYYSSRGATYYELKEYRKALDDETKAIELAPDKAKYYSSRGLTYRALEEHQKALDDEAKALELAPDKAG